MIRKTILLFLFTAITVYSQVIGPRFSTDSLEVHLSTHDVSADTAVFYIYNGGDGILKLYDFRTSCDCLTFSIEKTELAEQEKTELHAYLKIPGGEEEKEGKREEYIYLKTNDDDNTDVRLIVTY